MSQSGSGKPFHSFCLLRIFLVCVCKYVYCLFFFHSKLSIKKKKEAITIIREARVTDEKQKSHKKPKIADDTLRQDTLSKFSSDTYSS